jgi:hypothetical protein
MRNPLIWLCLIPLGSCSLAQNQQTLTFDVLEAQERVEVYFGEELFTAYRHDKDLEKPVLFPVNAPGDITLTRGFPLEPRAKERIDHPHHVGLWFNYGDVNGFDFWNNSQAISKEAKGHYGRIIHQEILEATAVKNRGILRVSMDWVAPDNEQAEKWVEEETTYRFIARDRIRIMDRITRLTAVSDTVVFTDNKEGMLAIRVDRAFELPAESPLLLTDASGNPTEVKVLDNEGVNGWYLNSEGDEGPAVWGKNARWVKLSGKKQGQSCSMVLMDHPDNLNHPACWHARGYGLFSINNLGRRVYNKELDRFQLILEKGESLVFRHRFAAADMDMDEVQIEELFQDFISE